MGAAFGTADWIVVASQTEQAQLGRMLEYRRIYVPVVILALLLVTWFTFRQARNIVEPVGSLARRARSMAQGDFDERLRMKRDDEFGELADAFDRMSHRLGRQFASLKALSQIDGLILTTQDTAQVIRTVLQRLAQMVPADSTTLSIFERDQSDHARTYYMTSGPEGAFMMDRQRMDESTRAQLELHWHGGEVTTREVGATDHGLAIEAPAARRTSTPATRRHNPAPARSAHSSTLAPSPF